MKVRTSIGAPVTGPHVARCPECGRTLGAGEPRGWLVVRCPKSDCRAWVRIEGIEGSPRATASDTNNTHATRGSAVTPAEEAGSWRESAPV